MTTRENLIKVADYAVMPLALLTAPLLRFMGRYQHQLTSTRRVADRFGYAVRSTHYYHPTYTEDDLPDDVSQERYLPGFDFNEAAQLAMLGNFSYRDELVSVSDGKPGKNEYAHGNPAYAFADAESLYSMVRYLKPRRLFEIGSGYSTLMAQRAVARNRDEDGAYRCEHVCIEPYEMPWLSEVGVKVTRERVQDLPRTFFGELAAGDILFIDSSHVIRPFGDVLYEFLELVPDLPEGVYVHVHDIFTPRDYPDEWLRKERRLWNEQYLLEALLNATDRYEVVLMLNWLKHNHFSSLAAVFPHAAKHPEHEPGAFWFRIASKHRTH